MNLLSWCEFREGQPTEIKELKDEEGYELDGEDQISEVLDPDSKVVAELKSTSPGLAEASRRCDFSAASATASAAAADAGKADMDSGEAAPEAKADATATLATEGEGTTIQFHTIGSCRQAEPAGTVEVVLDQETLGDLKRKICAETGVQYEAPVDGAAEGSGDDGDEESCDVYAHGRGACLCRTAFGLHGQLPEPAPLYCQPCDAPLVEAIAARTGGNAPFDCLICRSSLTEPPPGDDDDDSTVSVGVCGHVFHTSCIKGWLQGGAEETGLGPGIGVNAQATARGTMPPTAVGRDPSSFQIFGDLKQPTSICKQLKHTCTWHT
eukprot:SAG31_NODE_208_length_20313_cov_6.143119_11_plen_324_part_00